MFPKLSNKALAVITVSPNALKALLISIPVASSAAIDCCAPHSDRRCQSAGVAVRREAIVFGKSCLCCLMSRCRIHALVQVSRSTLGRARYETLKTNIQSCLKGKELEFALRHEATAETHRLILTKQKLMVDGVDVRWGRCSAVPARFGSRGLICCLPDMQPT